MLVHFLPSSINDHQSHQLRFLTLTQRTENWQLKVKLFCSLPDGHDSDLGDVIAKPHRVKSRSRTAGGISLGDIDLRDSPKASADDSIQGVLAAVELQIPRRHLSFGRCVRLVIEGPTLR
jgi:hypothetical protein